MNPPPEFLYYKMPKALCLLSLLITIMHFFVEVKYIMYLKLLHFSIGTHSHYELVAY